MSCFAATRDEIRRCLSKLELLRFLNRRACTLSMQNKCQTKPAQNTHVSEAAIHEAIGSSRDFETIRRPPKAADCHAPTNCFEKSDGLTPADLW